jgi:hypothetical protein
MIEAIEAILARLDAGDRRFDVLGAGLAEIQANLGHLRSEIGVPPPRSPAPPPT